MNNPPIGALCGIPFLLLAALKLATVGGGVDGVKLWLLRARRWLPKQYESSESDTDIIKCFFSDEIFLFLSKFFDVPTICSIIIIKKLN